MAEDRKRARAARTEASIELEPATRRREDVGFGGWAQLQSSLREIEQLCQSSPGDGGDERRGAAGARSPNLFAMAQPGGRQAGQRLTPVLAAHAWRAAAHAGSDKDTTNEITPLTRPACSPGSDGAAAVQTLGARALPLSPFEAGEVPDAHGAPSMFPSYRSPFGGELPAPQRVDEAPTSGSATESPAVATAAALPVSAPAGVSQGSFHHVDELRGQLATMTDIPANSQGTSQESSLAETKVLRCSQRLVSVAPDALRGAFGFSDAFSYLARLGDTKSCTVYLAKTPEGDFCAIKEVKRPFSSRTDRAEIARELTIAAALPPHPGLVRYICGWQEQRKLHLQLELCEGGNLGALLRSGGLGAEGRVLDEPMLWTILWDAASGLAHLHTHGVAHMDLKPENLFLHASGALKLGDLGIAVALDSPAGWQEGDGRYLAPEILARSGPSAAADVFSLGISLLQCATGQEPASSGLVTSKALAQLAQSGRGRKIRQVIGACLHSEPAMRPPASSLARLARDSVTSAQLQRCRKRLAAAAQAEFNAILGASELHCSPSFGHSPGGDAPTPSVAGGAAGPCRARPGRGGNSSFDSQRPWSSLFPGAPRPTNPRAASPARTSCHQRGEAPTLSGKQLLAQHADEVGTPPSAPRLKQRHERTILSPSRSLRHGALSFNSGIDESRTLDAIPSSSFKCVEPASTAAGALEQAFGSAEVATAPSAAAAVREGAAAAHSGGAAAGACGVSDAAATASRARVLARYFQSQAADGSEQPGAPAGGGCVSPPADSVEANGGRRRWRQEGPPLQTAAQHAVQQRLEAPVPATLARGHSGAVAAPSQRSSKGAAMVRQGGLPCSHPADENLQQAANRIHRGQCGPDDADEHGREPSTQATRAKSRGARFAGLILRRGSLLQLDSGGVVDVNAQRASTSPTKASRRLRSRPKGPSGGPPLRATASLGPSGRGASKVAAATSRNKPRDGTSLLVTRPELNSAAASVGVRVLGCTQN